MRFLDDGTSHGGGGRKARVAVVGSGAAGLASVWALARAGADVTLYEKDGRIGGHANTVHANWDGTTRPVDTGFIVYNEQNYPNLVGLFGELGVETAATDMSFSASFADGGFEYSGSGLGGLFARRRNALSPSFWRMVRDIVRFYKQAPDLISEARDLDLTLGEFLDRHGFSSDFTDKHLLPMAAAIWSSPCLDMGRYPAETFVRFFSNHGLLSLGERPQWRTVINGSKSYVTALMNEARPRLRGEVQSVRRTMNGVQIAEPDGSYELYDAVIMACHAPQTHRLLADKTADEDAVLGAFRTDDNLAVLHTDASLMPKRKRAWASWNYLEGPTKGRPSVTYWMNSLQPLGTGAPVFVTLNPCRPIASDKVLTEISYAHPVFDRAAIEGQTRLGTLQGRGQIYYAGAWMGYGFHEDGIESGLAAAEAITGWARPWAVDPAHSRVPGAAQPLTGLTGLAAE